MNRRTAIGVPGILSPNAGISTAPRPKNAVMYSPMLPQVTYSGTRMITADAMNAYHGSPTTITTTSATSVSELNDGKLLPIANVYRLAVSAPEIAAMNAEMQKTITRVTLTLSPAVSSASGESPMARSSLPSRVADRTATLTATITTTARMTKYMPVSVPAWKEPTSKDGRAALMPSDVGPNMKSCV